MTTGESIAAAGVGLGLLVNGGALVWGAATMKSELKQLEKQINDFKGELKDFLDGYHKLKVAVAVIAEGTGVEVTLD